MWSKKRPELFWVIFDTSQYRPYYADVHELLATPAGVIMRYQYRADLLTPEATSLAKAGKRTRVIFAYSQHDCHYTRTDGKTEPVDEQATTKVIPTRLGTMVNVIKDGGRFYFDFVVEEYPRFVEAIVDPYFASLMSAGQAPPEKWVGTSNDWPVFDALAEGDPAENWQRLVDVLGREPIQFAKDAFWRIHGPFTKSGRLVRPRTVKEKADGRLRQLRTDFLMLENRTWKFQLISSIGRNVPPDRLDFTVQITSTDTNAVRVAGSGQVDARHYDEKAVEYTTEPMPPFRTRAVDLEFKTTPEGVWPAGPALKIRCSVRKSHIVSTLGVLSGVAAVLLGVIGGSALFKYDVLNGLYLLGLGLLLGAIAKYMLMGKIEFGR